ncbi:DNA alkylation repair protein [Candidatus Roizmanbacteria bacterium CG02_land_8_20_14_3_00_36_15]|uniref:DNA alkylation repair protein n=2 Tax=Candidatus Roizmaniibacteriota TaxID=1752723 RepID=A0A2M8KJR5_9BACT|nr:MAG: DNA alkylation repair protein [Candidatus Roizmanbacteria bacterium CG03_land_8_20_14_0_80_36_21]PIV38227.1 MAG: DNA alkylation repair protein [Candidatus Roizmanbacteria bacterium CG02_land_8_20_14_3_00_36_15]PIY70454.1 MAG: DNA alkylation repair protein [Candidatus Roizmanbacteria bacterium CG_4_10_14_0_8_um_filter_36_36]PJA53705.1 MAG: DNA alkylation repair protein [Candidatus Roizmanbacteria bacterium CG_4_9_14_3_um_filter_36_11]PJC81416.1 MAG: DNA alkylation repair protein [Candida
MLQNLIHELKKQANPEKAKVFARFFKTRKGEYGEGDKFWGLTVPQTRAISKKYFERLDLDDIQKLLRSKIHEYRLSALMILRFKYEKGNMETKRQIVEFYLKNTKYVNNWDLVDLSCHYILGNWLLNTPELHPEGDRKILDKLGRSKNLWEKRIAIISTFEFIRNNQFEDTLKISEILLHDKHDLIHKAVGWMLREVGKRDQKFEEAFLKKHYKQMPRTMLKYAIEKFSKEKRDSYLKLS